MDRVIMYYNELLRSLNNNVQSRLKKIEGTKISGVDFENIVYDALIDIGVDEGQIQHSTQKFPDFVITDKETGRKFGLEVKKTDSKKWKVPGGSIFESLRNETDETYVIMAKLGGGFETRIRKYKECIEDLTVTHSPRFQINMELNEGEDYLTKNNAQDLLNMSEGPELNRRIRELLRSSKSTWYSEETTIAYSELSHEEKEKYLNDGVALFPEVVGRDYKNFTPWMVYKCLVWCGNVRDIFSAGGTVFYKGMYISAVMNRIISNFEKIAKRIIEMTVEEQVAYWGCVEVNNDEKLETWIDLVDSNLKFSTDLIKKNKLLSAFRNEDTESIKRKLNKLFIDELKTLAQNVWENNAPEV